MSGVGNEPNEEWLKHLEGLTLAQVKAGLDADLQRNNEFPPNLGRFLHMCNAQDPAGLPSFDVAFQAAAHGDWSKQGVFCTVQALGGYFDFRRLDTETARKRFAGAWEETKRKALAGEPLEQPPEIEPDAPRLANAAISPHRTPGALRARKKAMAEIRATLGLNKGKDDDNGKKENDST